MTQSMLEVHNLVKRYNGLTAVDDLSFEVYQGEIFGLLEHGERIRAEIEGFLEQHATRRP